MRNGVAPTFSITSASNGVGERIAREPASQTIVDPWSAWGRTLWRAAGPCVAIMCAMTIWAALSGDLLGSKNSLATDLESTVLAPLANLEDSW